MIETAAIGTLVAIRSKKKDFKAFIVLPPLFFIVLCELKYYADRDV